MKNVVVDANFSLAQVLPLPYSQDVIRRMGTWQSELPHILVPGLWEYEVVTGLRRAYTRGYLTQARAEMLLDQIFGMEFDVVPATVEQHKRAMVWAERLGQARAYDSQYVALAEHSGAELWTADERLHNRTRQLGVAWVHWVGEE